MSKFTFIALLCVFNIVFAEQIFLRGNNKLTLGVYAQLQQV